MTTEKPSNELKTGYPVAEDSEEFGELLGNQEFEEYDELVRRAMDLPPPKRDLIAEAMRNVESEDEWSSRVSGSDVVVEGGWPSSVTKRVLNLMIGAVTAFGVFLWLDSSESEGRQEASMSEPELGSSLVPLMKCAPPGQVYLVAEVAAEELAPAGGERVEEVSSLNSSLVGVRLAELRGRSLERSRVVAVDECMPLTSRVLTEL